MDDGENPEHKMGGVHYKEGKKAASVMSATGLPNTVFRRHSDFHGGWNTSPFVGDLRKHMGEVTRDSSSVTLSIHICRREESDFGW